MPGARSGPRHFKLGETRHFHFVSTLFEHRAEHRHPRGHHGFMQSATSTRYSPTWMPSIITAQSGSALRSRLIISASFSRVAPTNRRLTALLLVPRDRMPDGAESSDRSVEGRRPWLGDRAPDGFAPPADLRDSSSRRRPPARESSQSPRASDGGDDRSSGSALRPSGRLPQRSVTAVTEEPDARMGHVRIRPDQRPNAAGTSAQIDDARISIEHHTTLARTPAAACRARRLGATSPRRHECAPRLLHQRSHARSICVRDCSGNIRQAERPPTLHGSRQSFNFAPCNILFK
jgi:hypothetical protein